MKTFLSAFLTLSLLLALLPMSAVAAQDGGMELTHFRLRQAWSSTGRVRAIRTSMDLMNAQALAGESLRVVYEYYDSRRDEWRQSKRRVYRLPDRDRIRLRRSLPRTARGAVDVWIEHEGEKMLFIDDAFVLESADGQADVAEEEMVTEVSQEEVLRAVRRHIREQSMYYIRSQYYEQLKELDDPQAMFELLGDPSAQIFPSLKDLPQQNLFTSGEITTYKGYDVLRLPSFNSPNIRLTKQFLEQIQGKSLGAIIDLRGNDYGSINAAVDALEPFMNTNENMVFTKKLGSGHEVQALYKAKINPFRDLYVDEHHIPIAVLVDEHTSAAAEIFAATISEYNIGRIIGQPTSGDTDVKALLSLPDGSYLQLTSSQWYTGKGGKDLSDTGVSIDKEVTDDPETEVDEVLEAAYRYIYQLPTKHFLQRGIDPSKYEYKRGY